MVDKMFATETLYIKENRGNFGEKSDKCSVFVQNSQKLT